MARWPNTILVAIACGMLFAAVQIPADAQVRIRIRSGKSGPVAEAGTPEASAPKVVAVEPTPEQAVLISRLIEQLGASTLRERDRAMSELAGFGASAITLVEDAVEHDDDEIGHRCVILLEVLNSGQAELFLAARKLGMSITELQTKLSAQDPTDLLALLEQNSGAGMAPVWARVMASLAPMSQRFPAALACRRAEGPEGYGSVLARAARDNDTRKNASRVQGLTALVALVPPGMAEHAIVTLAALPALENDLTQTMSIDGVMNAARSLCGLYESTACLGTFANPENERMLAAIEVPKTGVVRVRERLLLAIALAMTPAATESQLNAARLPPLTSMSPRELDEYCELCSRSGLRLALERALTLALAHGFEDRRLMSVARGLATLADPAPALAVFDVLPAAAQLAMLDAWWFAPPDPQLLQPFLIARLASKQPMLRNACARGLAGYRAESTARALALCALTFADTAATALAALAPMVDVLPAENLKQLGAYLDKADFLARSPLIEVLVNSGDGTSAALLKERWKKHLTRNELQYAMLLLSRDDKSAAGAFCAARLFTAAGTGQMPRQFAQLMLESTDLLMLRHLLERDEAAGFALLTALATDPYAQGSSYALLTLAIAGKDGALIPDLVKFHAAGNDPRSNYLTLAIAISQSPQGEEFRNQTLKRGMDGPDAYALIAAVAAGRAGKMTREELLTALASTPQNAIKFHVAFDEFLKAPLPASVAKNVAMAALYHQDQMNVFGVPAVVLMLGNSGVDMLDLLYGAQQVPVPRTTQQIVVTALMGDGVRAREIIGRLEPTKDGRDFEEREFARAWLGMTSRPLADAILRTSYPDSPAWLLLKARGADAGRVSDLRVLFDSFGSDPLRTNPGSFAMVTVNASGRGDGLSLYGAGDAATSSKFTRNVPMMWFPLCERWLGEKVSGDFAYWWASRRGLVQFDAKSKRFSLATLK